MREGLVRDTRVFCCGHSVDLMRGYFDKIIYTQPQPLSRTTQLEPSLIYKKTSTCGYSYCTIAHFNSHCSSTSWTVPGKSYGTFRQRKSSMVSQKKRKSEEMGQAIVFRKPTQMTFGQWWLTRRKSGACQCMPKG